VTAAVEPAGRAERTSVMARFADSERLLWPALLAPAIIYIVLLVGFPFLLSIFYSLSSATVATSEIHFVGLENFTRIIHSDTFWRSLWNTIVFTVVSQVFVLILAGILATALIKDFRGKWLVRLLILLPWVAPISLGSIGWLWISIRSTDHQLDRVGGRSAVGEVFGRSGSASQICDGGDHCRAGLAHSAARHRDRAGRAVVDPAGYP